MGSACQRGMYGECMSARYVWGGCAEKQLTIKFPGYTPWGVCTDRSLQIWRVGGRAHASETGKQTIHVECRTVTHPVI